jgi:cysteine desulfurase
MSAYFDANATTPVDPEVLEVVLHYLRDEYGNAGSRTHEYGAVAARAVQMARREVAEGVGADASEVIFTSGATEANNLAILGLRDIAERDGRMHIVSTTIEHKAVLEPIQHLEQRGFSVTWIAPDSSGEVAAEAVLAAVRPDTMLVSIMHANNETGVIQPVDRVAHGLAGHPAYLHVDAAQGYGKADELLGDLRIDLMAISGHKIFAPKGVGALIARRRGYLRPPLAPLMYGGGQERGLRPGTAPVALIAGLGAAASIARRDRRRRLDRVERIGHQVRHMLNQVGARIAGADAPRRMPHVANASIPGTDSEALMLTLKGSLALSNGSACTSYSYEPSHVLTAMGLTPDWIDGAVRFSWSHLTEEVDWGEVIAAIERLRGSAISTHP